MRRGRASRGPLPNTRVVSRPPSIGYGRTALSWGRDLSRVFVFVAFVGSRDRALQPPDRVRPIRRWCVRAAVREPWGGLDDAQLREQPEGVRVGVLDDDLASGDLGDRDGRDAHPPSGGRDAAEVAGVGRFDGVAGGDLVVQPENVVDGDVRVGECGRESEEVLSVALDPGDHLRLSRVDADVVRGDEPFDSAGIALVPDLLDRI